jgi:hypothetical protein
LTETTGTDNVANEEYATWLDELAAKNRFGAGDRLGTANLIDDDARKRAADSVVLGACLSLARPIDLEYQGIRSGITIDISHAQIGAFPNRPPFVGPVDVGNDLAHIGAHGQTQTHLDGINHIGRAGRWYSGFSVTDRDGPSIADIAQHVLFTRGVLVDIPAVRGSDWVDAANPVTGEDIDAALDRQGAEFSAGDALLLYMGRDRFEQAGQSMEVRAGVATPGAGAGAARWIAEHDASILAWDFQDAVIDTEPVFQVHLLIWAIGLQIVDNCDLGAAAEQVRRTGRSTGELIVATPPVPGATGAIVQPLFIQ